MELEKKSCNFCKKEFGYFGPEKQFYYCSTYCSDMDVENRKKSSKWPFLWKRQSISTYKKAVKKSQIEAMKKDTAEVVDVKPKVIIRKNKAKEQQSK